MRTIKCSSERIFFQNFLNSCNTINKQTQNKNWDQIAKSSEKALKTLEQLSQIQITEGKVKLASANAMYNDNNSLGQLEIALLIILGGITFYLLIVKKTKRTIKIPEPPSMN